MAENVNRRLNLLSSAEVWELNGRALVKITARMESLGADALRYGWDWPTANIYHPHLCRMFRRSKAELQRRHKASGLTAQEFVTRYITTGV